MNCNLHRQLLHIDKKCERVAKINVFQIWLLEDVLLLTIH